MELYTHYLTENPCYQTGQTIAVEGLMLHSVGCSQPDPLVFVNSWNSASQTSACVHGFLGGDVAYETLPMFANEGYAHRGWHCGSSGNNTHIGIEMCEPATITYTTGSTFTCSDVASATAYVTQTTATAVELFALLCAFHGLDPLTPGVIVSHAEGYALGIASNHADPEHLWSGLGMDYDMDSFRADVAAKLNSYDQWLAYQEQYLTQLEAKDPDSWSADARAWAEDWGIVVGDGTGQMSYRLPCTREMMVVMLYRLWQNLAA